MNDIYITWLGGPEIAQLDLTNDEILGAIEDSLAAQGRGETVIHPRMHLEPWQGTDRSNRGHFNVLRGCVHPLGYAGVKVVSDFYDNYKLGLRSEMALLLLFSPEDGTPKAVLDASDITDIRTGAVTAIGAKYLARKDSKVLGHIGARGTAYWNVRLLNHLFDFEEIRVHSRRPESREAFGARLRRELGKEVIVTDNWRDCLEGADIMVEASRLARPEPLFKTAWVKEGATVIPYGTQSALEMTLTDIMDKIVMDDWGQARSGPFGALRAHVDSGKLTEETLHAELGEIVCGKKPGREASHERILLWHRGLSLSDIALGDLMLKKAETLKIGQRLRFQ
jgi:ornithine cyclodeaminase